MRTTNIHEAKTHLSRLVDIAYTGEEIIICKAGKPMAKLVPYVIEKKVRKPGLWAGRVEIAPDFDELPAEFLEYFT